MLKINPDSKKYGIIGFPLKHTKSPAMHNGLFELYNINAFYFPFEINNSLFSAIAPNLKYLFSGFNVTVPFKEEIIKFLDSVSIDARNIGAVNTVYFDNNSWVGENTDWLGFLNSLKYDYNFDFNNKNVLILGAGGSARACFYAALKNLAKSITIANRTVSKAFDILNSIKHNVKTNACSINETDLNTQIQNADIIINTTSVGLDKKDIHYVNFLHAKETCFAYDLIYSAETDFIIKAKQKGLKTGNGKGMLARQGSESFKIWTGINPDVNKMVSFI